MNLSDLDFELPPELIAQEPLKDRAASRMLVLWRDSGAWQDHAFRELPAFLQSGDCLVLNDSRVIPTRLLGHREGFTGDVEIFLVRSLSEDHRTWRALVRPGRKIRTGDTVVFPHHLQARIVGRCESGERLVRLECTGDVFDALERSGHTPLPPYIRRPDRPEDRQRYQTVYAREPGSVAAPTAGLHFTPEVLEACRAAGADIARVTLHVGQGTFEPLRNPELEKNHLHSEYFHVAEPAAQKLRAARRRIAVGTTSVRTLESLVAKTGDLNAASGETDLFIVPGFVFRATSAMLTNFHLPKSSLLALVAAFAGRSLVLEAYRHAVEQRYRFFSYGDCMLIL